MQTVATDYLVIGGGAAGLAFTDTLITETDAEVTIVERRGRPGGHWNDAYSFVTLHQPSAFYGVNSLELSSGRKDSAGLNRGLHELASGAEVCGYYGRVLGHKLLPSGRVRWQPMCNYLGSDAQGAQFESLLSGERTRVTVRKKVVDATYCSPAVPATHRRRFDVAPGVDVVPPGALPGLGHGAAASARGGTEVPRRFVILGAGKTAMDTAVWLLQSGASPAAIQWIVPRDSWLINRLTTQPGAEFFEHTIGSQADQMQAFAEAGSTEDLFLRLEACGALLRIHRDRMPGMFHFATLSPAEVELLRSIESVVRLGRVRALHADHMELELGRVPVAPGTLFVDCTASAVEPRPVVPIFQGDKMVLQIARLPQPAFSAALAAYIEAHYEGDAQKNRLCASVPFPHTLDDYPRSMAVHLWNQAQWGQDKVLRQWIRGSRLDGFGKLMTGLDPNDAAKQAIVARLKQQAMAAMANLPRLTGAGLA